MDRLKEATIKAIKRMPDGVAVEDIMYQVNLVGQVIEGLKDAENGKTISSRELLKRVSQWDKSAGRRRRRRT